MQNFDFHKSDPIDSNKLRGLGALPILLVILVILRY